MGNTKLVVEVLHATNLPPKDGEGSASPYVEVEFDSQRLRTKTKNKDLDPVWNEKLEFTLSYGELLDEECIDVRIYTQRKGGHRTCLGKVKVEGVHVRRKGTEGADKAIGFQLERGWSIFSMLSRGELYLKLYCYDEEREKAAKLQAAAIGKNVKDAEEKGAKGGGGGGGGSAGGGGDKVSKAVNGLLATEDKGPSWMKEAPSGNLDFAVKPTYVPKTEVVRHDLVQKLSYLFVRVERARGLAVKDVTGSSDPFVEVKVGNSKVKTAVVPRNLNPVWNEVFAFSQDQTQAQFVEITVWDYDTVRNDFMGFVSFDITEVPERHPPDSPLAPQWYRLESRSSGKQDSSHGKQQQHRSVQGEIMLSVWLGTQADEAFPRARQSDSGWVPHTRSTIYLSPRLWYLRVEVLEAQDLILNNKLNRVPEVYVKVELGFQAQRTRAASSRTNSPTWHKEEMLFVAAEPFVDEVLVVSVQDRVAANKDEMMGFVRIPLTTVQKRVNAKLAESKWYDLEREKKDIKEVAAEVADKIKGQPKFMSRIHLMVCLEGGYHVLDEATQYTSDTSPSEKRLVKTPVAVLELAVRGAVGLQPMKTRDGKSCTDAYCVAKYGRKWIRTRTILDSLAPQWHEQYMWDVHDTCTVLTVGVFDNNQLVPPAAANGPDKATTPHPTPTQRKDEVIGKVRIRLSTLETDRLYSHRYPLIGLDRSGVKKRGEVELAVRVSCLRRQRLNMMFNYWRPLLPKLHYTHPIHVRYVEMLREYAMKIVITRLARSEPPLRAEVVRYMLDVDSYRWSLRKSKANWYRIVRVFSGCTAVVMWFQEICAWKNPLTTVLVHILYIILVWYPELILPTLFLYMFLIGAWQYRFRPRQPPHMDVDISYANSSTQEELDEEFDPIPSTKTGELVRLRYDRMRALAGRIQTVMGDLATQLERLHAFLSWRDPRATTIFITFCLLAAIILYVTPFKVIAILVGLYVLRHPRFRSGMPAPPMNFFRRLPALSDKML